MGLTTDDTVRIGNPANFPDVDSIVPADEAKKKVVEELRATEKPDIIITASARYWGIMMMATMVRMPQAMSKWHAVYLLVI
ncbi:hypothetical protein [Providencia hangzhouensis]|uniref:hypothetical protein n=1 Tax=Providencia hangzhouensis TaxID=3031799 RepID=UPI003F69469F